MKVSKIIENKKIRKRLQNELFPSLYNQDAHIPSHPIEGILGVVQKEYQKKTQWNSKNIDDLEVWISSQFVDYSLRKVGDVRGIRAIKKLNLYYLYKYLTNNLQSKIITDREFHEKLEQSKEDLLLHLYSGLVELKHVSSLEYPYLSPPNEFWTYRFKYLKDLPFNLLIDGFDKYERFIEFTKNKIEKSYSGEINYVLFNDDIRHSSDFVTKITIINSVRESLTPNRAKRLKEAVLRSKEIKDFEIDIHKIIMSIE